MPRPLEYFSVAQIGFVALCAGAFGLFAAGVPGRHLHIEVDRAIVSAAVSAAVSATRLVDGSAAPLPRPAVELKLASSARQAFALIEESGLDLQMVGGGAEVPRVFFTTLPADIAKLKPVAARKGMFVMVMLPLVLRHNEAIAARRGRLMAIAAGAKAGREPGAADREWLRALARDYGTAPDDLDELLLRVDSVPPSLAIAQAIQETGWGTSRFAREGNALFGEHTRDAAEPGMVPARRASGRSFRVRAFPGLLAAIEGYSRNLNTHRAYAGFRETRREMRLAGRVPDGLALAAWLQSYSELGPAYVQAIGGIISRNGLGVFDDARLSRDDKTRIVLPDSGSGIGPGA